MTNVLKCGSTRSGKSYSSISDVVNDVESGHCAIVVLDPHAESLARPVLGHLIARGHRRRCRYDRYADYRNVLDMRFLEKSTAKTEAERFAENEDNIRLFTSVISRQQGSGSLSGSPQKEEWVMNAGRFYINQRRLPGEDKLLYVFEPQHPELAKLLKGCTSKRDAEPFHKIADGTVKPSEYQSAKRIINGVCGSPAYKVRVGGPGNFQLGRFLDNKGVLLIEGESKGNVSPEAQRAMFGATLLNIIRYVRTRKSSYPRVRVYLDEANNARLITDAEKAALAECQKYGLDLIIMVQNLDFPSTEITKGVLSNCLRHEWFYNGNVDVLKKIHEDVGGDREFDVMGQVRQFKVGERVTKLKTNDSERIWFDRAPLLEDPFGLPGLTNKKIDAAIAAMHQTSDYRNLMEQESCNTNSIITENETLPFSQTPGGTSALPPISQDISPADLLATDDWGDSPNDEDDGSEQSEQSA